jgi:hypothetical protein
MHCVALGHEVVALANLNPIGGKGTNLILFHVLFIQGR